MKVFIAQINPTVGALSENRKLIERAYAAGVAAGADVVMLPELAVTGYPPRDLLEKQKFVDAAIEISSALVAMTGDTALLFGSVTRNTDPHGKRLRNAALVARNGRLLLE